MNRRTTSGLTRVLVASLLVLLAPAAHADCTYIPLASGVPVSTSLLSTNYTFTSPGHGWGAMGERTSAGTTFSMGMFSATASAPACVQGGVISSILPTGVNFAIADFRPGRTAPGPWYPQVNRGGGGAPAVAEWDSGGRTLVVDAPAVTDSTDHVLQVYDVFLEGGLTYVILFQPGPGADQRVLLFSNPGSGSYWTNRSGALLEVTGTHPFTAPTSDHYALVVVNDNGVHGAYSIAVDQCQPPVTLSSGVSVTTGLPLRFTLDQETNFWSACGVRGGGSDDWDIFAYLNKSGAQEPVCFTDSVTGSLQRGAGADVVVGDFNTNPTAAYYARVQQVTGSAPATVEWDDGPDLISVGAGPISRSVGAGFVVEIWDVDLVAGQSYWIQFQRSGAVDARFLVFEDPTSGTPYWTGRAAAVLTGSASAAYVPAVSGYHGLAVVSDNGGVGGFQLAVYGTAAAVPGLPEGPLPLGITELRPNPVLGRARLAYRLGKAAHVTFDLLDVNGRQVARLGELDAGTGSGAFDFEAKSGSRRLPAGIYFVRMSEGRAALSIRKFILLP